MFANGIEYLRLALDLAVRDLQSSTKRTALGFAWILLTPLLLLGIYTLVFGVFLGVKWSGASNLHVGYALPMFIGLIVYLFFSDIVSSSTGLLVSKRTYVVKSAFPIWVLILSNVIRAAISFVVSFFLVIVFCAISGVLSMSGFVYALLIVLVGIVFFFAVALLLAVSGPFLGDLSHFVRLALRVLFYASPVTYPMISVPENYQILMWINPLTSIIEPFRNSLLYGAPGTGIEVFVLLGFSSVLMLIGVWIFSRVKGVLSDVV
jgi:lipopolysaccharide transport system permease protein